MTLDLSLVKGVPRHILPENIDSIQIIEGGLNNRNLLLNSRELLKIYLERDEKNDPVYLRYLREKDALFALDKYAFAPRLLNSEETNRKYYIKRQWVDGSILTLDYFRNQPERIMIPLSSLHKNVYTSKGDYDYFDVIERYIQEYMILNDPTTKEKIHFPQPESIEKFYLLKNRYIRKFDQFNLSTRIHGDLIFSNIITPLKGEYCIFIDWEYTTSGNPLIDLAYLFTQNNIPKKSQNDFLAVYEEHSSIKIEKVLLGEYCLLMNLMSALWYVLQALRLDSTQTPVIPSSNFRKLAHTAFSKLPIQ
jgi:thiamine kinase-like enzyme